MQMLNRSGDLIKSSVRSVQSLVHQALKVTELLQKNGAKKGDRIVLVFFPSVEFSVGLYACFLGGFVAIPVPPPIRLTNDLLSFSNAVEKSGAKLALSHGIYQKFSSVQTISHKVSTFLSPSIWLGGGDKDKKKKKKKDEKISWPSKLTWVYLDGCCKSSTKDIKYPELVKKAKDMASRVNPEDLAYLQLTSGSTGFYFYFCLNFVSTFFFLYFFLYFFCFFFCFFLFSFFFFLVFVFFFEYFLSEPFRYFPFPFPLPVLSFPLSQNNSLPQTRPNHSSSKYPQRCRHSPSKSRSCRSISPQRR